MEKKTEDYNVTKVNDNDKNLTRKIQSLHIKCKFHTALFWFFLLFTIAMGVIGLIPIVVIGFIVCLVFAYFMTDLKSKLKAVISDNIVKQALEDVFDNVKYDPNKHISERYIHNVNMGIGKFNKISGNDYIKAEYKGLSVELSDVRLTNVTEEDSEYNKYEKETKIFCGLWLICDLGEEIVADIHIIERGKMGKVFGGKGIKTENDSFNKQFYVESSNEDEALNILTPQMTECILEMNKKADGKIYICLSRRGKVHIAIDSGKDFFEIGKMITNVSKLREKFVREITYVTDLIDELKATGTLYK